MPKIPPPPPVFILRGHENSITAVHFTNEIDNAIRFQPSLISGSDKGEIFIWDLQSFRTYHRFTGHYNKMIVFLVYYKSTLLSQGRDDALNIWEYSNKQWRISRRIMTTSMGFCASEILLADATAHLYVLNEDKRSLEIYNYETACKSQTLQLKSSEGMCMCLKAFQRSSKTFILTGYESGNVGLWDCEAGNEVHKLSCHKEPIMCLDFDAQHKNRGISGSPEGFLEVWKVTEDFKILKVQTITVTNPGTNAVKIRNDGKIVLAAGYDFNIRVYSWKSLKPLAVLKFHKLPVQCLSFCPVAVGKDTSIFASGSKDKNVALWSLY